jgi:Xaa-Pro aminopeptidase
VDVVSSADLMQYATQRWSPAQLEGHRRCAVKLGEIVNQAFRYIGELLSVGPSEFEVAEFIRGRFAEEGLEAADGPIVATNAHCSDPHYEPMSEGSSVIRPGDWVLIDLWARESSSATSSFPNDNALASALAKADTPTSPLAKADTPAAPLAKADTPTSPLSKGGLEGGNNSVYADITWVAYVGDSVPTRHQKIFDIVTGGRDAALKYLEDSYQQGVTVQGWQVDEVARTYIAERGYGDYFTHRLGHSISYEVHGEAVNLDNFETQDTRQIIPGIGFSIEPGIYLPEFGVRSEIDAFMSEDGPFASSPVQREVVLIKGEGPSGG